MHDRIRNFLICWHLKKSFDLFFLLGISLGFQSKEQNCVEIVFYYTWKAISVEGLFSDPLVGFFCNVIKCYPQTLGSSLQGTATLTGESPSPELWTTVDSKEL